MSLNQATDFIGDSESYREIQFVILTLPADWRKRIKQMPKVAIKHQSRVLLEMKTLIAALNDNGRERLSV